MVDADEPVPEWIVADAAADVGDERQKSAQALRAAGGVLGDFLVGTVAVEGAKVTKSRPARRRAQREGSNSHTEHQNNVANLQPFHRVVHAAHRASTRAALS